MRKINQNIMKKFTALFSTFTLSLVVSVSHMPSAQAAESVLRYLNSENYVQKGDVVIGIHLDEQNQLEFVVLNLKTKKIYPIMLNEDPPGNLGRDFLGSGAPNFHSISFKNLKQLSLKINPPNENRNICHQYLLNWDPQTNSYLVQFLQIGEGYSNYKVVKCN